ncbi:MAG: diguanylate cyclase [Acidobacteriota bacterium]
MHAAIMLYNPSDAPPDDPVALSTRPAFAEESAVLHRSHSLAVRDGLRVRLWIWFGGIASLPLVLVGAWILGAVGFGPLLFGVAASLVVAWALAYWAADQTARTIRRWTDRLSEQCCAIDSGWAYHPGMIRPDPTAPAEIRLLFRDFDRMERRVDAAFERLRASVVEGERLRREVEKVLESRDEEIRSRTVELQTANMQLERLARQDGLTGIANHRRFLEFAEQCWRICVREDKPMSVLMIDVDHFKAYNDIYGHQAGDQALRRVAETIAGIARRPLDLAARYGGEEFSVVLSHNDLDDARHLAEQARREVLALDIPHSGSAESDRVTVSVGVATVVPQRDTDVGMLISLADRALYRAKRNGRNRVEA